jgi:hypothetical protein
MGVTLELAKLLAERAVKPPPMDAGDSVIFFDFLGLFMVCGFASLAFASRACGPAASFLIPWVSS